MGIEMQMSVTMAGDGSITMSQDVLAPYVLLTSSRVLEWLTKNKMLAQMGSFEPAFAYYQAQFCLIDYYKATTGDNTKAVVQFNYGSQRFERVYNATTGEEISTTEIPLGGASGSGVSVDDALSFESTNPVQNKVVTENLDGIMHLDLDLSTLDSAGLESLYAQLVTLIGDSGRVKSFYCSYKGDVVKVDRLSMIGETTYVFVSKGVHQYVLIGNGLAELPWVFTLGENNSLPYLGLQNVSQLCKEAVIDIDGIRYPVTSYECRDSYITLYAFVKDHINQYKVDSDGNMTLVSSESVIGGGTDVDLFPSEYSDEFNDDFTN